MDQIRNLCISLLFMPPSLFTRRKPWHKFAAPICPTAPRHLSWNGIVTIPGLERQSLVAIAAQRFPARSERNLDYSRSSWRRDGTGLPTLAISAVTGGLIVADPHAMPYFESHARNLDDINDVFDPLITTGEVIALAVITHGCRLCAS